MLSSNGVLFLARTSEARNTVPLLVHSTHDNHRATTVSGRIDVAALHDALDGERRARGASWRELAKAVGVSPSLLTRMGQGHRPDLESFAALVQWLRQPAERFMVQPESSPQVQPSLEAELAPLLRARKDLSDTDREYLEQVVSSAITFIRAKRSKATP